MTVSGEDIRARPGGASPMGRRPRYWRGRGVLWEKFGNAAENLTTGVKDTRVSSVSAINWGDSLGDDTQRREMFPLFLH